MAEGWDQYEFRWMKEPLSRGRATFFKPAWTGQDLRGRTILLRTEQGFGDFIQFIRYARHVKALGATVLLELREEVRPIAELLPEVDRILKPGEPYPAFDFYANLMSLPRAFGTDLGSIPAEVPYVAVPPDRVAAWRDRIVRDGALNVGLVWAGSPTHARDRFRSLSLDRLAPLGAIEGLRFHSLQKGPASAEAAVPPNGMSLVDLGPELRDFGDTAAAIDRLDLVIAIDTAVVHLAGALAKPVWVLLPKPADFRWLEDRQDSPWYPTMRLFRQRELGEWDDVIAQVVEALRQYASSSVRSAPTDSRSPESRCSTSSPRPAVRNVKRAVRGLSEVAETRLGIMQYFPEWRFEGPSIQRYGEYLHRQVELLGRSGIRGRTILEAGAGMGYHALLLASAIGPEGHVLLYEGNELLKRVLKQNLASNGVSNTTLMRRLLQGCRPSEGHAIAAPGRRTDNASEVETFETIDELRLPSLDWLKVAEHVDADAVLAGASETIWRLRPRLFIATQDETTQDLLAKRVRDLGYSCWRNATPLFDRENFNHCDEDIFGGRSALVLLAVPEEAGAEAAPDGCERIA